MLADRYRIEEQIGAGGVARVYRGTDLRLHRSVAIKVVNPFLTKIPRAAERFVREARAMAAIDSPHLVPIYDVGAQGKQLYLVLKLLEGELLETRMRRGPLKPDRAAEIAGDVLEGLDRLHGAGMVHRDVKPSNVFVTREGAAVLLDLGIVFEESEQPLTARGMVLGTPEFMAPEHMTGQAADARSDLYATALMLLFAVTGKRGGTSSDASVSQRVRGDDWLAPLLEEIPPAWRPTLRRALARERSSRMRNAGELRAALLGASIPVGWSPPASLVVPEADAQDDARTSPLWAEGTALPGVACEEDTRAATPRALARGTPDGEFLPVVLPDPPEPVEPAVPATATPYVMYAMLAVAIVLSALSLLTR